MTAAGGPAWRQTIFHPFAQASANGRGTVLQAVVKSPVYDAKSRQAVPWLKVAAVRQADGGLVLFCLNRSLDQSLAVTLDARALGNLRVTAWSELRHDNLKSANTQAAPATVRPHARPVPAAGAKAGKAGIELKLRPASWNVIRLGA